MKVKIGLMLGGGGAKGAYQLGVIRALEEADLLKHIKSISGTSIGAINTLLLMANKNHRHMSEIWNDIDHKSVFGHRNNLFKKPDRMYSLGPLAETLTSKINQQEIRKSKYRGFATAALMYSKESFRHQLVTDTMEKRVFCLNDFGNPYDAVLASASIPVIFGPTQIDGFNYVDGGILDNYPIQPLIDDGCNLIFSVPLDDRFNPYLFDNHELQIIDFTAQSAFHHNIVKDYIDMLRFHDQFKDEKEELGYLVGHIMIRKMIDQRIIDEFLWMRKFKIEPGFHVLSPDSQDEDFIRMNRLKIKKNKRKKQ